MTSGKDPTATRRAGRERSDTLQAMLDGYIAARGLKAVSAKRYRDRMRGDLPDWLGRSIADISPQMVLTRYEELCRRSISGANLTMKILTGVCRRAIKILPDRADDTAMMRRVPTESLSGEWKTLSRRTSLLQPDDLPSWWTAVGQLKSEQSRRALQALLVTGLRANELLQLRWTDVDEARRRLSIRDSKTGPFTKIIGPQLASWLAEWRANDPRARVFPINDLRAALGQVRRLGGKLIMPDDLRRTYLTFGERSGAPVVTLKKLANHSVKGDTTFGYVLPSDTDLQHWAATIEAVILDTARGVSNIVELRRASP
jgi:integrase